jgi:hypothetical protein
MAIGFVLTACGGGGNSDGDNNPSNSTQPYSVAYTDYGTGFSSSPWGGASFVDNMPTKTNVQTLTQPGWTGQIKYGSASSASVVKVNNSAVTNVSPISVSSSATVKIFDPYGLTGLPQGTTTEPNLDGAYEICGPAPIGSISDNGFAATDVLITASATQITSVSDLAGQTLTFNQYCDPANQANPQTLSFDSSGNANFELFTGSTNSGPLTAVQVSAASFQGALNGTPYGNTQQGQVVWTAYRFVTASLVTKYVILERGSADGSYIGIWY